MNLAFPDPNTKQHKGKKKNWCFEGKTPSKERWFFQSFSLLASQSHFHKVIVCVKKFENINPNLWLEEK